jgi:hypothetical protein
MVEESMFFPLYFSVVCPLKAASQTFLNEFRDLESLEFSPGMQARK